MAHAIGKSLRLHSVIICDQVRREDSGKELLLGVYSGGVVVNRAPPAPMQIVVRCEVASSKPRKDIEYMIEVLSPSNVSLAKAGSTAQIEPPQHVLILGARLSMTLTEAGRHTVSLSVDGQNAKEVYDFTVRFNVNVPTAQSPVTNAEMPPARRRSTPKGRKRAMASLRS